MLDSKELQKLNKKLDKIGKELAEKASGSGDGTIHGSIMDELMRGANDIRNTMVDWIMRGTKTGRWYTWEAAEKDDKDIIGFMTGGGGWTFPIRKRDKPHRASAKGEPPATDSGELASRLTWDTPSDLEVEVGVEAGAPYAQWLEEGTEYMDERPFLGPAVEKHEDEIVEAIGERAFEIIGEAFEK